MIRLRAGQEAAEPADANFIRSVGETSPSPAELHGERKGRDQLPFLCPAAWMMS